MILIKKPNEVTEADLHQALLDHPNHIIAEKVQGGILLFKTQQEHYLFCNPL